MIEGAPIGMSFTFHDTYYRSHDSTYGKVSNRTREAGETMDQIMEGARSVVKAISQYAAGQRA